MKKFKYIVCFFLILFCLALSGELCQSNFDYFTGGLDYFYMGTADEEAHRDLAELSKEYNCDVFCFERSDLDMLTTLITVYVTETSAEKVKSICHISPGRTTSLFSGNTEVVFKDIEDCDINSSAFFFGERENIEKVNKHFRKEYGGGPVKSNSLNFTQWLPVALWLIFVVLLIILTGFDINFQRKENFLLVSMGKSIWKIILKNIVADTVVICLIALGIYLGLRNSTYLHFRMKETVLVFVAALLLNALSYLKLCRYDLKKALSSSNFSSAILSNCYVIKAITLIITIVVMSLRNMMKNPRDGKFLLTGIRIII